MPWFELKNNRYWLGEHTSLGLLVFDPLRSAHEREDVVALYVAENVEWVFFEKHSVKSNIFTIPKFDGLKGDALLELFAKSCESSVSEPIPIFDEMDLYLNGDEAADEGSATMLESSGTLAYDSNSGVRDIPIYLE